MASEMTWILFFQNSRRRACKPICRRFGCGQNFRNSQPVGVRGWSERSTSAKRPFGPPWSGIAGAGPRRHQQGTPLLQCNRGRAPNALATYFLLIARCKPFSSDGGACRGLDGPAKRLEPFGICEFDGLFTQMSGDRCAEHATSTNPNAEDQ